MIHDPLPTSPPARRRLLPVMLLALLGSGMLPAAHAGKPIEWHEPGLSWNPRAEFEVELLRNRQLRRENLRSNDEYQPALQLGARWQYDHRWAVVGDTELLYDIRYETGNDTESRVRLKINQLYGELQLPEHQTRVQLGRWSREDERAWLFDQDFDGLSVRQDRGRWQLEAMLARINQWERDLLDDEYARGKGSNYGGVLATYQLTDKHDLLLRAFRQNEKADDLRLNHWSLTSIGNTRKELRHWALVSLVNGKAAGRSVRGQALDVGATWTFRDIDRKPRITLGYAWGSGDDGQGTDNAHRQTGLHDNSDRMGGVASFPIYGQTLDPALSNLHILTAGAGFAPGERSSIDLVWHHYRQDKVGALADTNLRPRADLQDERSLGHGVDLVWGWRPDSRWRIKAIAGFFQPSDRFRVSNRANADTARAAWSGTIEIKYAFK